MIYRPERESGADEYGLKPAAGEAPKEYGLDSCKLGIAQIRLESTTHKEPNIRHGLLYTSI